MNKNCLKILNNDSQQSLLHQLNITGMKVDEEPRPTYKVKN